ncbi:MAG: glycoside hydrolase family 127 protein [Planctomycetota bacterium]
MRRLLLCLLIVVVGFGHDKVRAAGGGITNTLASPHARLHAVGIGAVRWTDGFWADRFDVCHTTMVPNMLNLLKDADLSHAYDNFLVAAGMKDGRHRGPKWNDGDFYKWLEAAAFVYGNDGDFYKWLEAAAFVYGTTRDEKLDRQMDQIIEVIGKAQRDDGYIHTPVVIAQLQQRSGTDEFQNRLDFETYNMGHLMTCACVHNRATGKTNLLRIAEKAADFLYAAFKDSPRNLANNAICPSHYMGLVELYRAVGNPKYLELAKGLIDARNLIEEGTDHNQDRIPFREQSEAAGHAVRANYLYAGIADVYAETGDQSLLDTLEKIWRDVAYRKMYVTGATGALYDGASPDGSRAHSSIQLVHQAYGRAYQLPNVTAYNESCATVGFVLWNWRMLAITGEARFADLLELALYNGVLATISLDGKRFFYTNPLARVDKLPFSLRWSRKREPYIGCFCCPPNSVRTIAEVSAYAYGLSAAGVWLNLYGSSTLHTRFPSGEAIWLTQRTEYPWEGTVDITLEDVPKREFSLFLRIPGWTEAARVTVNGRLIADELKSGHYFEIRRPWSAGDRIELVMPMSVQLLEAHPLVEEVRNQTAVRRGPLVYCLESTDLPDDVGMMDVAISSRAKFRSQFVKELLGGVAVLESKAFIGTQDEWNETLYRRISPQDTETREIRLIPYYTWANRGDSEMTVWIPLR